MRARTIVTKQVVLAECSSCHGTGLYSGMCEGPGVAVVCLTCDGLGGTVTKMRDDGAVETVEYGKGSYFKPVRILPVEIGKALGKKLEALRRRHLDEERALLDRFLREAVTILPEIGMKRGDK